METIAQLLQVRLSTAAGYPEASVQTTAEARFGDYQANTAMILAKQRRANPRQLAQEIVARLDVEAMCEPPEIVGPGFINFRLKPEFLAARFTEFLADSRLGVPPPAAPRKFVFDFSSPNVAKPMHVGHIRSTILGDALARIATFLGHQVVRDNHIGDWGTQFGMLLVGWKTELNREALQRDALTEMERIYKLISARTKDEPATLERVHAELVRLQAGDEENLALWHEMIRLSQRQFDEIYARLGIQFDVTLGESFYNPQLQPVVEELLERGLARESEGAICIFSDEKLPPEKDPFLIKDAAGWRDNPVLVRKKDGAANYTTTDLATLQHRVREWAPTDIVYVTDGRQQLHFRQLFATFERWQPEAAAAVRLAHVWFGSILGEDGRPFKTRSGETVRLAELLDEAEERALTLVREKSPEMPEAEAQEIARRIGLGAVKYADLLPNRQSDYHFSWERMLSLAGNTAPYLQNAYVRIRSIFRRLAEEQLPEPEAGQPVAFTEPAELALAKKLFQFGEIVPVILDDFRPNLLANYLYELADAYHGFYEACPVLRAEGITRHTRLLLCHAAAQVLRQGLDLLGIEVPERM